MRNALVCDQLMIKNSTYYDGELMCQQSRFMELDQRKGGNHDDNLNLKENY